jgi:hypothetical protein
MRIRQVKPAFWADAKIASLPHDARLFYIGLWMLADDDGWLRWDVAEMGKELYGFEARAARERRIAKMAAAIAEALPGKLTIYGCGHAELPKLAVHQHLAGTTRRVTTVHTEHSRDCPRLPATPRPVKVMVSEGNGEVSEGAGNRAQRATATTEYDPERTWNELGVQWGRKPPQVLS